MKKHIRALAIVGLLGLAFLEGGARLSGVVDFPIYQKDDAMGYIQRANQRGSFLNKNDWAINDCHLFGERYDAAADPSIFLIGDSVVWCGNPYRYEERLCVELEKITGIKVWSAGAGSWSSHSQIAYIERFPSVVADAELLAWVFNSGDFGEKTIWESELTHPTRQPPLASAYIFEKYLLPRIGGKGAPRQPEGPLHAPQLEHACEFIRSLSPGKKGVLVVLWPTKAELVGKDGDRERYTAVANGLRRVESDRVEFLDLASLGILKPEYYEDKIHPTPEGARVFARVIAEHLANFAEAPSNSQGTRLKPPVSLSERLVADGACGIGNDAALRHRAPLAAGPLSAGR